MRSDKILISKKAQITMFVIIAIVLVTAIVLVFYLTPLKTIIIPSDPTIQFQSCIKSDLAKAISNLSAKGGSFNATNVVMYQGERIEYLCYTNEYYKTCSNQQPLLKEHIEKEILTKLTPKIKQCYNVMKTDLMSNGYAVSIEKGEDISVELSQTNVKVKISGATFTREDASQKYSSFEVSQKSSIYNFVMIVSSILNWEARYGDSDITIYMLYYPNLKVEKYKQSDGSKIYILTDRNTNEQFKFATRSLSWPAGYGLGQTYKPL